MRKMVKQMRAGREWRAARQDGSNTIVFLVDFLQRFYNSNVDLFNFKPEINEKLPKLFACYGSQWSKCRLPTESEFN